MIIMDSLSIIYIIIYIYTVLCKSVVQRKGSSK